MTVSTTVAGLFTGAPVALAPEQAGPFLSAHLPAEATAQGAQAAAMLEPGERYAITRNVAVVPVRGLLTPNAFALERWLGWTTYQGLEATLGELAANEDVAAIVLPMDSPGGLVIGCTGAGRAVAAAASVKPVHALVHPLAASAAYWIASQATDITITPGSFLGSIGVLGGASHPVKAGEARGWQDFVTVSGHARAKRPDPTTEAGQAEAQRVVDAMEAEFHAAVSTGRSIPLADLPARLSVTGDPADGGAIFWGQEAVSRGLADRVETDADFWARIGAAYAPRQPRVRRSARAAAAAAQAAMARATL
ncbi:S49 family peptidase [Chachezhania sediminis]|uniref:S49 family peptidase n=1 Tax=Chachezhania sediminis TaxID=2599291 RepID=UPI00131EB4FE|nr:S49 family peptidase [Chachezhania sediminis]